MSDVRRITVYTDYKSPYAYLAKDLAYQLELDLGPNFLGSARGDADGRVLEENRSAHQWRRVKYSYMDCRRQARKRGLVIRGTQKIWDSSLALWECCMHSKSGCGIPPHHTRIRVVLARELDIGSGSCCRHYRVGAAPVADYAQGGRDAVRRSVARGGDGVLASRPSSWMTSVLGQRASAGHSRHDAHQREMVSVRNLPPRRYRRHDRRPAPAAGQVR
jgi:hypothetical protein